MARNPSNPAIDYLQQVAAPQEVYDNPVNLFVANFLGTPPINILKGRVENEKILINDVPVLNCKGVSDREVYVGIRPEGFILDPKGAFVTNLQNVEVMGRDVSIVSTHTASTKPTIRAIISAEEKIDLASKTISFSLKPNKTFIFDFETEERIYFEEVK